MRSYRSFLIFVPVVLFWLAPGDDFLLRADVIYECNTEITPPSAIYHASGGSEANSLVAVLPGCGYGIGGNAGAGGSIAINSQGDIFQSDAANGNIYEVTPGGAVSTFASGLTPSGLLDLAFDSHGNLFVADYYAGAIFEFSPAGAQSTFYSGNDPNDPTSLLRPYALAVDANGDVYTAAGCIDEITPGGVASVFSCAIGGANTLAFNGGALFATDTTSEQSIYDFSANGTAHLLESDGSTNFTVDSSGNLFYETAGGNIDELAAGSEQTTAFSTAGIDFGPLAAEATSTPEPNTAFLILAAGLVLPLRRFDTVRNKRAT